MTKIIQFNNLCILNIYGKFLFVFNLYIEACHSGESFSKFINTNYLIEKIYHLCLKRRVIGIQAG